MIFFTNCMDVIRLSDAELDTWRSQGVGGFVCKMGFLYGIGGPHTFTGNPTTSPPGKAYDLERMIRDTHIVSRAAARGMKMWLGIGLGNYYNDQTPLAEWFDDPGWSTFVLPSMRDLAAGARALGFAGIAFDEEMYGGASGRPATWDWNYPGNARPEGTVRAQARARGAQTMQAIVDGFPNAEIVDIHALFPEGWSELVQQEINGASDAYATSLQIDFWDGMTSVPGYGPIRFMDHTYGKTAHLYKATWDTAFTYDLNRMAAMFSQRLSNWDYASSRIHWSPFVWINSGARTFELARPPAHVAAQLAAARKWGMGGVFANYAYGGLNTSFDYTPYVPAMVAAATPGTVDTEPPTFTVGATSRSGGAIAISGSAADDMAVRAVQWRTASGESGTASMQWVVTEGSYSTGYQWRMDWSANIPSAPGESVTVTVEDSKGLLTSRTLVAP